MLSHTEIWAGVDALAARLDMRVSALAQLAGRAPPPPVARGGRRDRGTGVSFPECADLAAGRAGRRRGVPLIGLAQAGDQGFFDDAGYPQGQGWDEVDAPDGIEGAYALEISGDSMLPLYRDGDRIIVRPVDEPRRGDRVVVKTREGEVMAKEVARVTARRLELKSVTPDYPGRVLDRSDVAGVARILWASQ